MKVDEHANDDSLSIPSSTKCKTETHVLIEIASHLRLTFLRWKGFSRADAATIEKILLFLCVSFFHGHRG
jgi:hypothetical protein